MVEHLDTRVAVVHIGMEYGSSVHSGSPRFQKYTPQNFSKKY
jgi:hypothetical protein